jgi:site-specific recombinase XerD
MEFAVRGIRVRETTSTHSKDLAIKAERARRRRIEEAVNGIAAVKRPKKLLESASKWMDENEARWSKKYVIVHNGCLKHLAPYFKSKLLSEITAGDIGKYQNHRKKKGASNRTINIEVATLRMILKSNKLWNAIRDEVHMLPEPEDVGRALSYEEAARLLTACSESSQPSLYPAVVVYCNTGLRSEELRGALVAGEFCEV